jgi:hypothetical protein
LIVLPHIQNNNPRFEWTSLVLLLRAREGGGKISARNRKGKEEFFFFPPGMSSHDSPHAIEEPARPRALTLDLWANKSLSWKSLLMLVPDRAALVEVLRLCGARRFHETYAFLRQQHDDLSVELPIVLGPHTHQFSNDDYAHMSQVWEHARFLQEQQSTNGGDDDDNDDDTRILVIVERVPSERLVWFTYMLLNAQLAYHPYCDRHSNGKARDCSTP